mgnify:CR=1 FL=1
MNQITMESTLHPSSKQTCLLSICLVLATSQAFASDVNVGDFVFPKERPAQLRIGVSVSAEVDSTEYLRVLKVDGDRLLVECHSILAKTPEGEEDASGWISMHAVNDLDSQIAIWKIHARRLQDATVYAYVGRLQILGDTYVRDAVDSFSHAINLSPLEYSNYDLRAKAWAKLELWERASEDFKQAARLTAHLQPAWLTLSFERLAAVTLECAHEPIAESSASVGAPPEPQVYEELVDNPEYNSWSTYEPGKSIIMKSSMTLAGTKPYSLQMMVVNVTPSGVTIRERFTEGDAKINEFTIPAKIPKSRVVSGIWVNAPGKGFQVEQTERIGSEKIRIDGKDYECEIFQAKCQADSTRGRITIWRSNEIPGHFAKIIVSLGEVVMTSTIEKVDFHELG